MIAAHTIGTELVNKHKSKLEIGGHLNNLVWRAMVLKVHKLDDPEHIKSFAQLSFLIIRTLYLTIKNQLLYLRIALEKQALYLELGLIKSIRRRLIMVTVPMLI